MTRAAIYSRVSTNSRVRHGDAIAYDQRPEVQEEPLRRLAAQRGWTITRVYTDRGSGAKETLPALAELMRDARQRRFDVLLVWRFDRLSRSVLHFLQTVEELRNLGVEFVSLEQSFDTTTAAGKFTLTMFAALAELEREVIRDRVKAGVEYAKAHGTKSGKPIGRPRAVFSRDEAVELKAQGLSPRRIAAKLGVGEGTIRRVLRCTFNVKEARQNPKA